MFSPRGQRGLEAKIFGLGLMQCWSRSHENCPRGPVVMIIEITSFTLGSSLTENNACRS